MLSHSGSGKTEGKDMDAAAGRELFWQIELRWVFSCLRWAALIVLAAGCLGLVRWIRAGRGAGEPPAMRLGWMVALAEIGLHARMKAVRTARVWHFLVFYGFLALLVVTLCVMASHYGVPFLFRGRIYLGLTVLAELGGVSLAAGAVLGLADSLRVSRVEGRRKGERIAVFSVLLFVCLSGFLVEAERILLAGDPWRTWSFVGNSLSLLVAGSGVAGSKTFYETLWWIHAAFSLCLVAWIPFSPRLRHLLFAAIRRAGAAVGPVSQPPQVDLESLRVAEGGFGPVRLGIAASRDVTPWQRVGLLACMECGQCERLCPADQTGQPLSPKRAVQDLRRSAGLGYFPWRVPGSDSSHLCPAEAVSGPALWACRLCRGCEETCPAGVEHVPLILDLRRAEVLGRGRMPDATAQALRHLARTGNPYGAPPAERLRWLKEQGIPEKPPKGNSAWLLWTGCLASGDDLKLRVLSAWVSLLRKAGASFFALTEQASCCGEPARVLGEEDLFHAVARSRIRSFVQAGVEKVLVHCPHCYTMFRDVYPLLGGAFRVVHTSEFFVQALREGLLRVRLEDRGSAGRGGVAYHDPCFLGRYQGLYEPPREILAAATGGPVLEAPRHRSGSFCCGGGGGHFFMDLDTGERPASVRLEEMEATGARVLCVSCGFCLAMFDDAARRRPDPPSVRLADWLELLDEKSLPGNREHDPGSP